MTYQVKTRTEEFEVEEGSLTILQQQHGDGPLELVHVFYDGGSQVKLEIMDNEDEEGRHVFATVHVEDLHNTLLNLAKIEARAEAAARDEDMLTRTCSECGS